MKIPKPLRMLYRAWLRFSHVLGLIMSRIILTILWIVGFGLYAVPYKLIRIMRRNGEPSSTWTNAETAGTVESMSHQF